MVFPTAKALEGAPGGGGLRHGPCGKLPAQHRGDGMGWEPMGWFFFCGFLMGGFRMHMGMFDDFSDENKMWTFCWDFIYGVMGFGWDLMVKHLEF